MKIVKIMGGVLAVLLAFGLTGYAWMGGFRTITSKGQMGPGNRLQHP